MNVNEINPGTNGTLKKFIAITLPLTLLTVWVAGAAYSPEGASIFQRVIWPIFFVINITKKWRKPKDSRSDIFMV